jgi:hypothetical protein
VSAAAKGGSIEDRFADVLTNYARSVQEVATETQRRQWEAARDYWRAVQEQPPGGEEARSFLHVVQEIQKRWQEAASAYQHALQETSENMARGYEEAFRGYVAGLKEAWVAVDPATVDAATIAAIERAVAAALCGRVSG